jgi:hypothetical protein
LVVDGVREDEDAVLTGDDKGAAECVVGVEMF